MRDRVMLVVVVAVLFVGVPFAVWGNDSVFGGEGSNLRPVERASSVEMRSETIRFRRRAEGSDAVWDVKASYEFRNTGDESVEYQVGFPEPGCGEHGGTCTFSGFEDLRIRVDGEERELREGQVSEQHRWAEETGTVHLFDVEFPAGEERSIAHEFEHEVSRFVGGEELTYVTRTGAVWADTIGRARFIVTLPYRPWDLSYRARAEDGDGEAELELVEYEERLVDGEGETRLVFEARNWEPTFDFELVMNRLPPFSENGWQSGSKPGGEETAEVLRRCPNLRTAVDWHERGEEGREEMERDDLSALAEEHTARHLRRCRNAVYARHGYAFETDSLDEFFYGARRPSRDWGMQPVGFRKNPAFTAELLTEEDLAYAKMIQRIEELREESDSAD